MKHETRIRTLETKNKEQEKALNSRGILLNNNGHTDLDPDEVWNLFMEWKLTKTILYNEVRRHFNSHYNYNLFFIPGLINADFFFSDRDKCKTELWSCLDWNVKIIEFFV